MSTLSWLSELVSHPLAPNVWEISITGFGLAEVGSYASLNAFRGERTGIEAHHIVAVEHLEIVNTLYNKVTAPAVLIPRCLHRKLISPRITAEQNSLGGRPRDGKPQASREEILMLYREVYTWHSPFKELYVIAKSVLADLGHGAVS